MSDNSLHMKNQQNILSLSLSFFSLVLSYCFLAAFGDEKGIQKKQNLKLFVCTLSFVFVYLRKKYEKMMKLLLFLLSVCFSLIYTYIYISIF